MTSFSRRYPLNVPGKFYIDDQCTDCDLCRECAPENIRRDDRMGHSYVYRQPESDEEKSLVMEGVEGCPTEAVRKDGDQFDWDSEAIMDWNEVAKRWGKELVFELPNPVIPYEVTLREERLAAKELVALRQADPPWWKRLFRL